jgi:hypothetical protein
MAIKFTKGGIDGIVVLNVRELLAQPFEAPGWTDLRVGWLLSITGPTQNDVVSNGSGGPVPETIPPGDISGGSGWEDRVRIGLFTPNSTFCGFTNRGSASGQFTPGSSQLVSSDLAVGTTNPNFWRAKNSLDNNLAVQIVDSGTNLLEQSPDGLQQHFVQNAAGAGGYATLSMMRLQRPDAGANAKRITVTVPQMPSGHSSDVLFTNTPTEPFLRTQLEAAFPSPVHQFGPFTLSQVPDRFMVSWPFSSSRLRIHAMSFAKVR